MEPFWIILLVALALGLGAFAGFMLFGKKFYNQGYEDGREDGRAESVSLSGACGDCGWEADYADVETMLSAILTHTNDCPAKRY